jgi:hypothetical protein
MVPRLVRETAQQKLHRRFPDGSQIAIHAWATLSNGKESWDIVRITNWGDPDNHQFINVTRTDRANEGWPVWNPGWQAE